MLLTTRYFRDDMKPPALLSCALQRSICTNARGPTSLAGWLEEWRPSHNTHCDCYIAIIAVHVLRAQPGARTHAHVRTYVHVFLRAFVANYYARA